LTGLPNVGKERRLTLDIVICSYNRSDHLEQVVPLLAQMVAGDDSICITVAENSDDPAHARRTEAFLASFRNVRLIKSTPARLSAARNAAIANTQAKYIAYLDDDAQPTPGWPYRIIETFENAPNAAAAGGPIFPIWPHGRPNWLPDSLLGPLTILDRGPVARSLKASEHVYGANMAFVAERLREVGGFKESLGRVGEIMLLGNEETDIQDRLRAKGYEVAYNPQAAVGHVMHEDRLSQPWFYRRMVWQALSDCLGPAPDAQAQREIDESIRSFGARLSLEHVGDALFAATDTPATVEARVYLVYYLTRKLMTRSA
jgi:glucosyl-dolichyl phosphate glucuronosyltransferase